MSTKRTTAKRKKAPAAPKKKAARPAAPADATRVATSPGKAPARAMAVLEVLACPGPAVVGRTFEVGQDDLTLGRDADCTISLPDADVSRQHARIVRTGNSHVLVDMESTNGTRVGGKPISEATLRDGDEIALGSSRLLYRT